MPHLEVEHLLLRFRRYLLDLRLYPVEPILRQLHPETLDYLFRDKLLDKRARDELISKFLIETFFSD